MATIFLSRTPLAALRLCGGEPAESRLPSAGARRHRFRNGQSGLAAGAPYRRQAGRGRRRSAGASLFRQRWGAQPEAGAVALLRAALQCGAGS